MIRNDLRSHCEVVEDGEGEEEVELEFLENLKLIFTAFCRQTIRMFLQKSRLLQ